MSKRGGFLIVALVVLFSVVSIDKEQVGVDQVGVRVFLGTKKIVQPGETAFVIPFVSRFLRMTTKPVQFPMQGERALSLPGKNGEMTKVECMVRYQIKDPTRFIDTYGTINPQRELELAFRSQAEKALQLGQTGHPVDLTSSMERMIFTAQFVHDLNTTMQVQGVQALSFELVNW